MPLIKKRKTDEDREKEEIFKDVVRNNEDRSKDIKKHKRALDHKNIHFLVALLIAISLIVLGLDVRNAIITDVWQPLTTNDLLENLGWRAVESTNMFVQWLVTAPLFLLAGILGIAIFVIF